MTLKRCYLILALVLSLGLLVTSGSASTTASDKDTQATADTVTTVSTTTTTVPPTTTTLAPEPPPPDLPEWWARGEHVTSFQTWLHSKGHDAGPLDGVFGPLTAAAAKAAGFQVPDPPAPPPPPPRSEPRFISPPVTGDVWAQLAWCESRGNPQVVSSNGLYYGSFQFLISTWHSVGGPGIPTDHSYEVQLQYAQILQARSGWGQWPSCARQLGLL